MTATTEWEKEFRAFWRDEYVGSMRSPDPAIEKFRSLLLARDEEIIENLEGMKIKHNGRVTPTGRIKLSYQKYEAVNRHLDDGVNFIRGTQKEV